MGPSSALGKAVSALSKARRALPPLLDFVSIADDPFSRLATVSDVTTGGTTSTAFSDIYGRDDHVTMRNSACLLRARYSPANALCLRLRRGLRRRARAPRREGDRPRRDDTARRPGARRLHDHDGRVSCLSRRRRAGAGRPRRRGRRARRGARGADGEGLRRRARSLARLGSLRCGDLDAGDDGFDPQPRTERRGGRGARDRDRQRPVRARLVPAARPDVRRGGRRRRRQSLRAGADRPQGGRGVSHDVDLTADDLRELVSTFMSIYEEEIGRRVPSGAPRPAAARVPCGLRLLERAARAGLSPCERHPGRPRDGGERRPDGVREPRRAHPGRASASRAIRRRASGSSTASSS